MTFIWPSQAGAQLDVQVRKHYPPDLKSHYQKPRQLGGVGYGVQSVTLTET